jgi:serine/threonine protein kinase
LDSDSSTSKGRFDKLYIIQEKMDMDLCTVFSNRLLLNNDLIRSLMYQLLLGVEAIHSADVLHRDLKPGNLLYRHSGELKICDFGLARGLSESLDGFDPVSMTNYVATRWYRPPELILYRPKYGKSLDMWSVGCIFAEFLGRRVFLPGQSGVDQLHLILRKLGYPMEEDIERIPSHKSRAHLRKMPRYPRYPLSARFPEADPLALDLLEKILRFNPEDRTSASEALQHAYFKDMPKVTNRMYPRFDFGFDEQCHSLADIKSQILFEVSLYSHSQPERLIMDKGLQKLPTLMHKLGLLSGHSREEFKKSA